MHTHVLAQGISKEFAFEVVLYFGIAFCILVVMLYLFRAIFNIPSFLRYQKAQIRLLEEIAKTQGVDNAKVESIVSETYGWDDAPKQSSAPTNSTARQ